MTPYIRSVTERVSSVSPTMDTPPPPLADFLRVNERPFLALVNAFPVDE